ncbi:MAG: NADP-dependent phosphogluconate dehydrogenase [Candidatus Levyibacteriota bacterium]
MNIGIMDSKTVGIIGLGKMGSNLARRLMGKGWKVVGYNRSPEDTKALEKEGLVGVYSLKELVKVLPKPRVIISLLPPKEPTDEVLEKLLPLLEKDDVIAECANSFYKDTQRRAEAARKKGIRFIDVGVSGGPGGALNGACLMVGGPADLFQELLPLFTDMAQKGAVSHFEGDGNGHFIKMVHNGVEYGMMQSIAEGFALIHQFDPKIDLLEVSKIYNNGSVVESRLTKWLQGAFEKYGKDLEPLSGAVGFNGEGEWTAITGEEIGANVTSIRYAAEYRKESQKNPTFAGKILTAMRNMFGGHSIEKGKMT